MPQESWLIIEISRFVSKTLINLYDFSSFKTSSCYDMELEPGGLYSGARDADDDDNSAADTASILASS